jgi:type II secretory pathway pseudopilin PulG
MIFNKINRGKYSKFSLRFSRKSKGFAIIDLLVSTSIATMIMAVVLFSYRSFSNHLAVSAASQEIISATRQAQTYGLSVRETGKGTGNFSTGYGVSFGTINPTEYYIFADKNGNGVYDGDSTCDVNSECVKKELIRNNVAIVSLCGIDTDNVHNCPPLAAKAVNIVFPPYNIQSLNPDATITFTDSEGNILTGSSYNAAQVVAAISDISQTINFGVTITKVGSISSELLDSVPTTNHPPVITLVGDNPLKVDLGTTFTDPGATAIDEEDGNVTSDIQVSGFVNTLVPATYTLTYTVKDSGGLDAQAVTRSVEVGPAACTIDDLTQISTVNTNSGSITSFTNSGSYMYITFSAANLYEVYNMSDVYNPVLASSVSTDMWPMRSVIVGNYAYVTTLNGRKLDIFSLSDPSTPTLVGSADIVNALYEIVVKNNKAFLSGNMSKTIEIIDVTNAARPTALTSLDVRDDQFGNTSFVNGMYIVGNYLYVVAESGFSTLQIYDISTNPPTYKGMVGIGGTPQDVLVKDGYAYVSGGNSNFQVVDVSNPANPTISNYLSDISPTSYSIVSNSKYAFATSPGDSSVKVFNITSPTSIDLFGSLSTSNPAQLAISNTRLYVLDGVSNNIKIYNLGCLAN